MTTKSILPAKHRTPEPGKRSTQAKPAVIVDTNVILEWLETFDARIADLTRRQEALLRDLGVEPAVHTAAPEFPRERA